MSLTQPGRRRLGGLLLVLMLIGAAASGRVRADEPTSDAPSVPAALETAFADAAAAVAPYVVGIETDRSEDAEPKRRAHRVPAILRRPDTPASGLWIGPDLVLTAMHNVEDATEVRVVLHGGAQLPATVLARHEPLRIALLRVELAPPSACYITLAQAGSQPLPRPGAWLIVVGHGPEGRRTVNTGIVSALGRFGGRLLQTDASVNHANIGAPAVDIDGRLVGITVAPSMRAGINSGVGFVAPAAAIAAEIDRLRRGESITMPPRGFLGIRLGKEHLDPPGVEIAETLAGHAAAAAGLKSGDIITRIGGATITDARSLSRAIRRRRPGDTVEVVVDRDGERHTFEVKLGQRPEEER